MAKKKPLSPTKEELEAASEWMLSVLIERRGAYGSDLVQWVLRKYGKEFIVEDSGNGRPGLSRRLLRAFRKIRKQHGDPIKYVGDHWDVL